MKLTWFALHECGSIYVHNTWFKEAIKQETSDMFHIMMYGC